PYLFSKQPVPGASRLVALGGRWGQQPAAVLTKDVDHVGIAVAEQLEQERDRVLCDDLPHEATRAALDCVVKVDQEAAVYVDEQDPVLVVIRDRENTDVR